MSQLTCRMNNEDKIPGIGHGTLAFEDEWWYYETWGVLANIDQYSKMPTI